MSVFILNFQTVIYSIILAVFAFNLIINIPNLIAYPTPSSDPNRTVCTFDTNINTANNIIAILMRVYVPFCAMLTLNIRVISRLRQSKRRIGLVSSNPAGSSMSRRQYMFTMSTLIIDFTFLFFYTPIAISLSLEVVDLFTGAFVNSPLSNVIVNNLFSSAAQLLAFAYSVALIAIFFISNRFFKNELVDLLRLRTIFGLSSIESDQNN